MEVFLFHNFILVITSHAKGGVLIVRNSEGNGNKYVLQDGLLLVKANTYNAAAIAVTGSG